MKTNLTYRSLLDKSINSMLSAIEIYNKPNFSYREETFAILAINAWELLFKAYLLKKSNYKIKSLYVMEPVLRLNGEKSKRKKPKLNRANNPLTIGLFDVIKRIEEKGTNISGNLKSNIETLVELRDNAIHFHNEKEISKELQELGFACIKNYMNIIKHWNIEIELSNYNFYLMPLAYVDSKVNASSITTEGVKKYLDFVKNKVNETTEDEFTIAISIDIQFTKSNSFDSIGFRYSPDGISIEIKEEDKRKQFPLTYREVCDKARNRYSDFKQNNDFHTLMKSIKSNDKICYIRILNPDNINSSMQPFYSTNIWHELDRKYQKLSER